MIVLVKADFGLNNDGTKKENLSAKIEVNIFKAKDVFVGEELLLDHIFLHQPFEVY